jgi:hypothetical protein
MGGRGAPAGEAGQRIARRSSVPDFVADDAADSCAANGSDRAAACQNGSADGTDPGTDGGALVLLRHAGTSAQQHGRGNCTDREFLYRVHEIPLYGLNIEVAHRQAMPGNHASLPGVQI